MTSQEVAEEYNRRLNEIWDQYEEAIKAPIKVVRAASDLRDRAREELDIWYAKNYDGSEVKGP